MEYIEYLRAVAPAADPGRTERIPEANPPRDVKL